MQPRISNLRLSPEAETRKRNNKQVNTALNGEMLVDTGADTCCVGRGFTIVEYTDRHVTLRGYSDRSEEQERVPVVTAATAVTLDDNTTVILVIHEALYLGEGQHTSLLNLNRVRFAGHKADDIPQFLSQGTSIHGIKTTNEEYIPFTLQGKSSLLYVRVPRIGKRRTASTSR